ncbi:hypothetical protein [Sphaerisporangium sp. NPDC051011]|uniref:deazapurine DNA modification protein DpdA family protein n=1 Tax=Sphaerisporangium sp. NPDC051011 TaxID=3155792 RepID=UPI0033DB9C32
MRFLVRSTYLDHLEQWQAAGIDLREEPIVGLGSICRKGNTLPVALMISRLARSGLRLHTFGYKTTGLISSADQIVSSDSLAWSRAARWEARHPGTSTATAATASTTRLPGVPNCWSASTEPTPASWKTSSRSTTQRERPPGPTAGPTRP